MVPSLKQMIALYKKVGVNKTIAELFGTSVFVPKEFLYDLHPSMSYLFIADYTIVEDDQPQVEVELADGMTF